MGQFLIMKYSEKIENQIKKPKLCRLNMSKYSHERIIKKAIVPVIIIPNKGPGNWLVLISIPSLLRNLSSVIDFVLLNISILVISMMNIVPKIIHGNSSKLLIPLVDAAKVEPKLITNQNIKAHFLSLVSQVPLEGSFMCSVVKFDKFCISAVCNFVFKSLKVIISKLYKIHKQILKIIAFLWVFSSSISSFAIDVYDQEKIINLIHTAETSNNIPKGLLLAISKIESGSYPYMLGDNGKPIKSATLEESARILKQKLKSGTTNLDVGLMQLNYKWHRKAFNSIEDMLNPIKNIAYAAQLLNSLKNQHGDWQTAIRYYHSYSAKYNRAYSLKVAMCWFNSNSQKRKV